MLDLRYLNPGRDDSNRDLLEQLKASKFVDIRYWYSPDQYYVIEYLNLYGQEYYCLYKAYEHDTHSLKFWKKYEKQLGTVHQDQFYIRMWVFSINIEDGERHFTLIYKLEHDLSEEEYLYILQIDREDFLDVNWMKKPLKDDFFNEYREEISILHLQNEIVTQDQVLHHQFSFGDPEYSYRLNSIFRSGLENPYNRRISVVELKGTIGRLRLFQGWWTVDKILEQIEPELVDKFNRAHLNWAKIERKMREGTVSSFGEKNLPFDSVAREDIDWHGPYVPDYVEDNVVDGKIQLCDHFYFITMNKDGTNLFREILEVNLRDKRDGITQRIVMHFEQLEANPGMKMGEEPANYAKIKQPIRLNFVQSSKPEGWDKMNPETYPALFKRTQVEKETPESANMDGMSPTEYEVDSKPPKNEQEYAKKPDEQLKIRQ